MERLIAGCGYLGERVADYWLSRGDVVSVLTRSQPRANLLAQRGLRPLVGDVTTPDRLPRLPRADTVLWAVGHDRRGGKPIEEVYVDGFRHFLSALDGRFARLIHISSTGVYGQRQGQWVDEDSPCEPRRAGGKACLAAERNLLASEWLRQAVILRLAGIYGPGRLPRLSQLLAGEPLSADAEGVINLIHVDDAAQAVVAAAEVPLQPPRIFVVADGQPVLRRTFYETLADFAQAPPPVFDPEAASTSRGSRSGHKRVSNRRMLEELGVTLRYPSYREGLAAVVGQLRRAPGH